MRRHDLLFEQLMGPKVSLEHGYPISVNCISMPDLKKKKIKKKGSLSKANKYNVLKMKQRQNNPGHSFSKKKSCTVQLGRDCSPCCLPEASGHPSQPMSWLLHQGHLFPIRWCGEISLYPVQLGSGFFVLPQQCKRIRVNHNICPNVLSVKCFTARKIEGRNKERVYIINDLKIRNNLQQ